MESFSSTDYSKLDDDRACSSQEWKTEATTYDRSGRLDKTSWRMVRKVRPDHEEILLDGTAQSVRYGETLRDRSGRPDNINSQELARPQNFVMGNDEAVCRIKIIRESGEWSSAEKTEKNFQRCRRWRRTFCDLENVYGFTMESAAFMGKNFQDNHNSIVNTEDLTLKQMFDISAKLVAEQDEISGLLTIGRRKTLMEIFVIDWWCLNHQSFNAQESTSFQILYCVWERPIKIQMPTKLGRKG